MTEADIIRSGSSRWLRENEAEARKMLAQFTPGSLGVLLGWSAVQVNNMLTYLALVGDA